MTAFHQRFGVLPYTPWLCFAVGTELLGPFSNTAGSSTWIRRDANLAVFSLQTPPGQTYSPVTPTTPYAVNTPFVPDREHTMSGAG